MPFDRMLSEFKQIAEPPVYRELVKTLNGVQEVENPDHPENERRQAEFRQQANEMLVRYYLLHGVDVEFTEEIEKEIDDRIADRSAVLGKEYKPFSRKLFYLENIFTNPAEPEQLGFVFSAVHSASTFNRSEAAHLGRMFRNIQTWRKRVRSADVAIRNNGRGRTG